MDSVLNQIITHQQQQQFKQADNLLQKCLVKNPEDTDVLLLYGMNHSYQGETQTAIDILNKILTIDASKTFLHSILGVMYQNLNQHQQAITEIKEAIRHNDQHPEFHYNLGVSLQALHDFSGARAAYEAALACDANYQPALLNISEVYRINDDITQALIYLEKLLSLNPKHAKAHYNYGFNLMLQEKFLAAWPHLEWRLAAAELWQSQRDLNKPLWQGENLDEKVLLIIGEQGIGDNLLFIRFIKQLKSLYNVTINFQCHSALHRLLKFNKNMQALMIDKLLEQNTLAIDFDYYLPIMSLGDRLKLTINDLHANPTTDSFNYIRNSETLTSSWHKKISLLSSPTCKIKVGLTWSGNPNNPNDVNRSMGFESIIKLLNINNMDFFSLQKDYHQHEQDQFELYANLHDLSQDLTDFADTAAAIQQMDLVISVDTATAHLAGALDHKCWTLLTYAADWRWLRHRTDCPWYPSMRLFRQQQHGAWDELIDSVHEALSCLVQ